MGFSIMGFRNPLKGLFVSNDGFKHLEYLIHNGSKEVVLDCDITLADGEESKYPDGIKIDIDDLIIDGNGYSIDARGKTRIFECYGRDVQIKNITLKNGFCENSGGAIWNKGKLSLSEVTFEDNSAEGSGGAIYISDGEVNVDDSVFVRNKAKLDGGAIGNYGRLTLSKSVLSKNQTEKFGGALYNNEELNISRSSFKDNSSKKGGGALYNSSSHEIGINESDFEKNSTRDSGGAIYNYWESKLTVENSLFENNVANYEGGAIYNFWESELTVNHSALNSNAAQQDNGAAISNRGSTLHVFNSLFESHKSSKNIISNDMFLELSNTNFKDNQSRYIIENKSEKFNLSIIHCEFVANAAEEAIIFNSGISCIMQKCVFDNVLSDANNIVNESEMTLISPQIRNEGKTILNNGHLMIQKSHNLEDMIHGRGVFETDEITDENGFDFGYLDRLIHDGDSIEILLEEDICLENYEMDYYEGGIELDIDDLVIDGNGKIIDGKNKSRIFIISANNVTLRNITFKNGYSFENYYNPLNASGGAIRINHNTEVTIENCRFLNNLSQCDGGAIQNRGSLNVSGSEFSQNNADVDGGAICNFNGEVTIIESELYENTAHIKEWMNYSGGGALHNNGGKMNIIDSTFKGNTTPEGDGGAVHNNRGEMIIEKSVFLENTVTGQYGCGGAIKNWYGNLTVIQSTLGKNEGFKDGGAIANFGMLKVVQSEMTENAAERRGGAILNLGDLDISKSVFSLNVAKYGGAIRNDDTRINITESKFSENSSHESGGAINNNKGEILISKSSLEKNTANRFGGAISSGGKLDILESEFAKNISKNGGAVYISENGMLNILESIFSQNSVGEGRGGAIHNFRAEVKISKSDFTDNSACEGMGGAIDNWGKIDISQSRLNRNRANNGGAISNVGSSNSVKSYNLGDLSIEYQYWGILNISQSELIQNIAHDCGGALYNVPKTNFDGTINGPGEVIITESTINQNTAQNGNGGALYSKTDKFKLDDCTLEGNLPESIFEDEI